jgi:DNA end-binding protein Ku
LSLIDQYTSHFDIRKFKDEYSDSLLKIIKAKASGKRPTMRKLKVTHRRTGDLMEQLRASLNRKNVA